MKSIFAAIILTAVSFANIAFATPPPAATRPYCAGHCGPGSFSHSKPVESFYCIAVPGYQGTRVPRLPGYGYGPSSQSACEAAVANCKSRSAFGQSARCYVQNVYRN